jgi:hypothetical protein
LSLYKLQFGIHVGFNGFKEHILILLFILGDASDAFIQVAEAFWPFLLHAIASILFVNSFYLSLSCHAPADRLGEQELVGLRLSIEIDKLAHLGASNLSD